MPLSSVIPFYIISTNSYNTRVFLYCPYDIFVIDTYPWYIRSGILSSIPVPKDNVQKQPKEKLAMKITIRTLITKSNHNGLFVIDNTFKQLNVTIYC